MLGKVAECGWGRSGQGGRRLVQASCDRQRNRIGRRASIHSNLRPCTAAIINIEHYNIFHGHLIKAY